jgi:nucleoid DNA-binding protein
LIAANSGYYRYEVEDILKWLALTLQMEVVKGNTVEVKGLGTWMTVLKPERRWYNAHLEKNFVREEDFLLAYRSDVDIRSAVKKNSPLRTGRLDRIVALERKRNERERTTVVELEQPSS